MKTCKIFLLNYILWVNMLFEIVDVFYLFELSLMLY
jgi:hypothetical protein